jgi:tRNA-dihydrouridine synthase
MTTPNSIQQQLFYLAPLQGFTDYIFREAFASVIGKPDACFSPFIETHKPDHRTFRDVLPDRNQGQRMIPQILGNDVGEMKGIISQLQQMGYEEINWNLGCPFPRVVKKYTGAGLLPHPDRIDNILENLFTDSKCRISIKMRLGMVNPDDWKSLVPILNRYPLSEVIIHGRTASQMYKGEVNVQAFTEFAGLLSHPACYNGNVFTLEQWQCLHSQLPGITRWMLGRGLLSNPLLLQEIKNNEITSEQQRIVALNALHEQLLILNTNRLSGSSHVLNKMKPYWEYFAESLSGREKGLKKIKKTITLDAYKIACLEVFKL